MSVLREIAQMCANEFSHMNEDRKSSVSRAVLDSIKHRIIDEIFKNPSSFKDDLAKSVETFVRESGLATALENDLFAKKLSETLVPNDRLSFIDQANASWTKRVIKSINAMCTELSLPLARKRTGDQVKTATKAWNSLSTQGGVSKSGLKPIYSAKDFFQVVVGIRNPNRVDSIGGQWELCRVAMATKGVDELRRIFDELSPSLKWENFENEEKYRLGEKVIRAKSVAAAKQYLKTGCPMGLRSKVWPLAFGIDLSPESLLYFNQLKSSVVQYDLLLDGIMMQDVRMTAANDESFFVFEDDLHQAGLALLRDCHVQREAFPPDSQLFSYIRGNLGNVDFHVGYPPSGVVPFYGFSYYLTPFCFLYESVDRLYLAFRRFYVDYLHHLHTISSHPNGIVSLCCQFENILMEKEPFLFQHLVHIGADPLRLVFAWIMQAFTCQLDTEQTLLLWDRIAGFHSTLPLALLSVGILMFRKSSLLKINKLEEAEAVLSSLKGIKVIPLLQLVLFA